MVSQESGSNPSEQSPAASSFAACGACGLCADAPARRTDASRVTGAPLVWWSIGCFLLPVCAGMVTSMWCAARPATDSVSDVAGLGAFVVSVAVMAAVARVFGPSASSEERT